MSEVSAGTAASQRAIAIDQAGIRSYLNTSGTTGVQGGTSNAGNLFMTVDPVVACLCALTSCSQMEIKARKCKGHCPTCAMVL
jgi:hypothetical protein